MTGERNLISVITRTKDRREFLVEAMDSVTRQTWPTVEHVIVNDGGASVADLVDQFADRSRITYLEPGAVGRCRAGNLALAAARGEWIAYLDDDDLYEPRHLETLRERGEATGARFLYSDAWCVEQERSRPDEPWREARRSVPYSEDFSRVKMLRRAYIHIVTVLHRRECYERLGGFDESLEVLEDHDLFFRYAQDYDFLHVPVVTAIFRIRNDASNAVTALKREFVETRTKLFQRYLHMAMPEMFAMFEAGEHHLTRVARDLREVADVRVAALERLVEEQRKRLADLEVQLEIQRGRVP